MLVGHGYLGRECTINYLGHYRTCSTAVSNQDDVTRGFDDVLTGYLPNYLPTSVFVSLPNLSRRLPLVDGSLPSMYRMLRHIFPFFLPTTYSNCFIRLI